MAFSSEKGTFTSAEPPFRYCFPVFWGQKYNYFFILVIFLSFFSSFVPFYAAKEPPHLLKRGLLFPISISFSGKTLWFKHFIYTSNPQLRYKLELTPPPMRIPCVQKYTNTPLISYSHLPLTPQGDCRQYTSI